jgi:2-deoxy-D-gluconate 3-dehydrogenase
VRQLRCQQVGGRDRGLHREIDADAVLPGWIDTNLTRRARKEIDGLHDRVLARTPAARWGAIDDLAGIAVCLARPRPTSSPGQRLPAGIG